MTQAYEDNGEKWKQWKRGTLHVGLKEGKKLYIQVWVTIVVFRRQK